MSGDDVTIGSAIALPYSPTPARRKAGPVSAAPESDTVLVRRELESRSCPNWIRRCEASCPFALLGATEAGRLELAIPFRPDLRVSAGQAIVRRHVADRAVQPPSVVLLHAITDDPPRVLQVQRRLRAHRFGFQR